MSVILKLLKINFIKQMTCWNDCKKLLYLCQSLKKKEIKIASSGKVTHTTPDTHDHPKLSCIKCAFTSPSFNS